MSLIHFSKVLKMLLNGHSSNRKISLMHRSELKQKCIIFDIGYLYLQIKIYYYIFSPVLILQIYI